MVGSVNRNSPVLSGLNPRNDGPLPAGSVGSGSTVELKTQASTAPNTAPRNASPNADLGSGNDLCKLATGWLVEKSNKLEPQVTSKLKDIAENFLFKLEVNIKREASIKRKIEGAIAKMNSPTELELRERVEDSLRYRCILDEGRFWGLQNEILAQFSSEEGFKDHKVKERRLEDGYRAVHAYIRLEGLKFQLKFHTPATAEADKRQDDLYAQLRQADSALRRTDLSSEERRKIEEDKQNAFTNIQSLWVGVDLPAKEIELPASK